MEQSLKYGQDRRAFLTNAGRSASVLALAPLLASVGAEAAAAAPMSGKYDFDTPYNRLGTDSVHWDLPKRTEHMSKIIAGMGVADMDFRCAPAIMSGLRKRMEHENWGYIDMDSSGPQAFIQGIIDWNKKRYGINVINHNNLGIGTGVHSGLVAALRAISPPGSKVLMITPIYNGFYYDLPFTNTVANESQMKYVDGKYQIDWDDLERRMTPDTKTMILCNPNNPTGNAWTKADLNRIGELCLKHKIIILSDEIHCDFVTKGQKYTPISTLDNKDIVNNSITFKSGSKSFSLAGMKCAWFFSTNPDLFKRTAAMDRADLNTLGMIAEQSAYAGGEDWLNQCVDYIDANHDFTQQYIKANIPMLKVGRRGRIHLSGLAGYHRGWTEDRRPEAGRRGKQEAAADQHAHRQAHRGDGGRYRRPLVRQECLCGAQSGQHLWQGRPQSHAHEHRHRPSNFEGGAGQHGRGLEEPGLRDCRGALSAP